MLNRDLPVYSRKTKKKKKKLTPKISGLNSVNLEILEAKNNGSNSMRNQSHNNQMYEGGSQE